MLITKNHKSCVINCVCDHCLTAEPAVMSNAISFNRKKNKWSELIKKRFNRFQFGFKCVEELFIFDKRCRPRVNALWTQLTEKKIIKMPNQHKWHKCGLLWMAKQFMHVYCNGIFLVTPSLSSLTVFWTWYFRHAIPSKWLFIYLALAHLSFHCVKCQPVTSRNSF